MKKPGGRPTIFSEELADTICERLALGESLRAICRDDDMPAMSAVFRWLAADQSFREQYAHAREAQADALADDILDIADTAEETNEAVRKAQLRIESRKWIASKLKPKKYNDRVINEVTGADGGPIQHDHIITLTNLTDDQLDALEEVTSDPNTRQ
ncbi:MAG: hypothetical protein RIS45_1748 [Planctomycetota bacterium]|jgi:hypothetical protein